MLPIDAIGYQQHPVCHTDSSASDDDGGEALDPQLPHSHLPAGQRPRDLNGTLRFLASDESDTGTDTDSDTDPHDNASRRVVCRHLALHYCLRSHADPDHAPSAQDLKALRRHSLEDLDNLRDRLATRSRALHLVCARDFGVFLRQTFGDMQQALAGAGAQPAPFVQRLYYISTGCHGMALRLVCRQAGASGQTRYETSVYDPNRTDHQVQSTVDSLYPFTARPLDHGFLSYILARDDDQAHRQACITRYFETAQNPALQMAFYELRLEQGLQAPQAQPPVHTNWASSPRATLYQAFGGEALDLYRQALDDVLAQATAQAAPELLQHLPGFDHAVLAHLMVREGANAERLRRWRSLWAACSAERQVSLLSARDGDGLPWSFLGAAIHPDALAQWIDMLQSLEPAQALQAMAASDGLGRTALSRALRSAEVLRALDPVLRRCAKAWPGETEALLAHEDPQGLTALGHAALDGPPEALQTWLGWLQEWVPAARRAELLRAPDRQGQPALARAIAALAKPWLAAWGEAVAQLPDADRLALLRAGDAQGLPLLLHTIRQGNADGLRAWAGCAAALPPAQRAELLAGRNASGEPLLAQAWCERHPVIDGHRRYLRPEERVTSQHEALRAWGELLRDVPTDARLDMLAGVSAAGEPAWVALSRLELLAEIELLRVLCERLVPAEQRVALQGRMAFASDEAQARFLGDLGQDPSLWQSTRVGLQALGDWIAPPLREAILAIDQPD